MVALEVTAEVGGLGVAELGGDALDGLAGGKELAGGGHAFGVKPVVRRGPQLFLAKAFNLAHGDAEELRGGADLPA